MSSDVWNKCAGFRAMVIGLAAAFVLLFPAFSPTTFATGSLTRRTIAVEDMLGRKVVVPAYPRRIVALAGALRMVV